jgi:aspartyl-tRNA(Asn)/glutamyl-tRNA(Gln) amidotransferase subunit A
MAVAATGSDTGGSVRIPAALCGCVGFKPSFGRVSTRGLLGACPTFDHVGVLTRTVADADVILEAVERSAIRGAPPTPFAPLAPLRIGVPRAYFFDRMPPDVARAIEDALVVLRSLAAEVRDVTFPIDEQTMATIFDPIVVVEIQARFAGDWQTRPDAFSPSFAAFLRSERPASTAVDAARRALDGYRRDVEAVFRSVDLLVLPTVPVTAPSIDGPIDGGLILRNTWPFNAAGTPALSLPCGLDGRGLPIGLQLVGAVGNDRRVLDGGRAFQAATAWHQRRPAAADA